MADTPTPVYPMSDEFTMLFLQKLDDLVAGTMKDYVRQTTIDGIMEIIQNAYKMGYEDATSIHHI